jgi:hypothetical protein
VVALSVFAGAVVIPGPAAFAATTTSIDNLSSGQLIKPGPLLVSGRVGDPQPGEVVRVFFDDRQEWNAVPAADGRWSTTVDTGPLADGIHIVWTDTPSAFGGTIGAQVAVFVDEDPDDVVITSPTMGPISAARADGIRISGRVAHPELVDRVFAHVGGRDIIDASVPPAADGSFSMTILTHNVPEGEQNIAVIANCGYPPRCAAMGTVAVTVTLPTSARITTPAIGQVLTSGDRMSIGVQVDNPGPTDSISGTVDGTIPVRFGGPMRETPTRDLYWANLSLNRFEVGQGSHTLRVVATLRTGQVTMTDVPFVVDFNPPTSATVSVPASTQLTTTVAVNWSAHDEVGVTSYDVRYRTSSATARLSSYAYPRALQATTLTRTTLPAIAGARYCFSSRARDAAGRTTDWSSETCTTTPYDDRWLTPSAGATRTTPRYHYRQTATTLAAKGSATRTNVTASRVGLLAYGCPTCGAVDVFLAGAKLGRLDLKRTTSGRYVIWLPIAAPMTGTLHIKSISARTVELDGVLIQR